MAKKKKSKLKQCRKELAKCKAMREKQRKALLPLVPSLVPVPKKRPRKPRVRKSKKPQLSKTPLINFRPQATGFRRQKVKPPFPSIFRQDPFVTQGAGFPEVARASY